MDEVLEIAVCRLVIGQLRSDELPEIATQALERGLDSPSLRELAGLSAMGSREARDLFQAAVGEFGMVMPTKEEALLRLVRKTASEIVSGDVPPYEGARWIWRYAANEVEEEGDLRIFIGLASEREDHPESAGSIDAEIVKASRDLLGRAVPRRWLRLQARRNESPLSRSRPDRLTNVSASELGVSTELAQALDRWADDYDATFGADERTSGFLSEGNAEAFVAQGRSLSDRLQGELGGSWKLDYYPEPIRPPGLRLRTRRGRLPDAGDAAGG
jgi:hypothetical protein